MLDEPTADPDAADEVQGNRLFGSNESADLLEIRYTDWDYCVAAGWVTPAKHITSDISRHRSVDVPLYRRADIDALRDDWEAVRAVNSATRRRCVCSRRCRQHPGKLVLARALQDAGMVSPSRHLSWGENVSSRTGRYRRTCSRSLSRCSSGSSSYGVDI